MVGSIALLNNLLIFKCYYSCGILAHHLPHKFPNKMMAQKKKIYSFIRMRIKITEVELNYI